MQRNHEGDRGPGAEPTAGERSGRAPWSAPELTELPPLTDLTLVTGDAVGGTGNTGGTGSTVF